MSCLCWPPCWHRRAIVKPFGVVLKSIAKRLATNRSYRSNQHNQRSSVNPSSNAIQTSPLIVHRTTPVHRPRNRQAAFIRIAERLSIDIPLVINLASLSKRASCVSRVAPFVNHLDTPARNYSTIVTHCRRWLDSAPPRWARRMNSLHHLEQDGGPNFAIVSLHRLPTESTNNDCRCGDTRTANWRCPHRLMRFQTVNTVPCLEPVS